LSRRWTDFWPIWVGLSAYSSSGNSAGGLPVDLFLLADATLFDAAAKRLHLPLIEPGADNF